LADKKRVCFLAAVLAVLVLFGIVFSTEDQQPAIPEYYKEADVASYMRDCVEGVLDGGGVVPETCRSADGVQQIYGVDVWFLLQAEHARAVDTAQRILRGEILRRDDYRACIKSGLCSSLPLPRSGNQEKDAKVMQMLRELADGGQMSLRLCAITDICRALVKAGIYDPRRNEKE